MLQYLTPKYVDAFLALDKKVYDNAYQVGKEATLRRLKRNAQTDITVMDKEKMVGYISLCPVPRTIYAQIKERTVSEEEIETHVVAYQAGNEYDAYLSSIVVDKESYPHFSGKELFALLQEHICMLHKRGVRIQRIIAVAVSIAGRRTLQRMRFLEIKENIFVYDCRKQGASFIAPILRYLTVAQQCLASNRENHWGSV